MVMTGIGAPTVIVAPPNTPAPPPISLLTQNNVISDDRGVVEGDGTNFRWEAGGGTSWLNPIASMTAAKWWAWFGTDGAASSDKDDLFDGGIQAGPGHTQPPQFPVTALLYMNQGALAEWALRSSVEGSVETQALAAMAAALPRTIEQELWKSEAVVAAVWDDQFRLCDEEVTLLGSTGSPPGVIGALALAEQAAADFGFIDCFGGAFIHCSPMLASLEMALNHGLEYSPSYRSVRTCTGAQLVYGPGASGTWATDDGGATTAAEPGSFGADNIVKGWMFVTPPVRIRLAPARVMRPVGSFNLDTNEQVLVVEQSFVIECAVGEGTVSFDTTTVAIPVDYSQEL